jgi:hypothetical protein
MSAYNDRQKKLLQEFGSQLGPTTMEELNPKQQKPRPKGCKCQIVTPANKKASKLKIIEKAFGEAVWATVEKWYLITLGVFGLTCIFFIVVHGLGIVL